MITSSQPRAPLRAIALVGFMGAGKTSVGRELAERLAIDFIDLDDLVVGRAGKSVTEIFGQDGEAAFRKLEAQALQTLLAASRDRPFVLALGGGAFVQKPNADRLRKAA